MADEKIILLLIVSTILILFGVNYTQNKTTNYLSDDDYESSDGEYDLPFNRNKRMTSRVQNIMNRRHKRKHRKHKSRTHKHDSKSDDESNIESGSDTGGSYDSDASETRYMKQQQDKIVSDIMNSINDNDVTP